MAESSGDGNLDSLSDTQRDTLHNFQEITAINELERCVALLERHDWNLESAVNDNFGMSDASGEPEHVREGVTNGDAVEDRQPSAPAELTQRVSQDRIVQQRQSWMGWITAWILIPYRFSWTLVTDIVRFIGSLIWPGFGRAHTEPVEDVVNFKEKFEEHYGTMHPTFYEGAYSQALNDAKKELRFLLVYLHSEDHQDTPEFCRTVLSNNGFREYVNGNGLFWACDVNTNEGSRVSRAMRQSTYPFLAVVCLRDNKMTIVWRMNGIMNLDELIASLARCFDENEPALVAARAERMERNHTQALRKEQDNAYRESLLEDQRKAKRRQEEENERRRIELEKQERERRKTQKLQDIARRREECKQRVEAHIEPDLDDPSGMKIRIRLPSGTLINRRFFKSDKVELLYDLSYAQEDSPASFLIVSNFPRRTFSLQQDGQTSLENVGLKSGDALFVQDTSEDSSDEDSS